MLSHLMNFLLPLLYVDANNWTISLAVETDNKFSICANKKLKSDA